MHHKSLYTTIVTPYVIAQIPTMQHRPLTLILSPRLAKASHPLLLQLTLSPAGIAMVFYLLLQLFKSTMNYWYVKQGYKYKEPFLGCSVSNIDVQNISNVSN